MAFLRRNSALFSLVCASAFMLDAAHAADITSAYTDTGNGSIHFSGMVEEGDSKKFIEVYETMSRGGGAPTMVVLDSFGGDVREGLVIGLFIAEKKMATIVESKMNCFSSCISIFAAGNPRTAYPKARLGVHRAADISSEAVKNKNKDNADARAVTIAVNDYYRKFKVPDSIRIAMIDTPPDKIYQLTEEELKRFNTKAPAKKPPKAELSAGDVKKKLLDTKLDALTYMDQGKYLEAAQMLEKMKYAGANDHELYAMLGKAYFMSGNRNQAIIHYTASVKINPHQADSWKALGELVADDGNIEWATQCFVKFYDNTADKDMAYAVLEGLSRANKGKYKDLAAASARKKIRR